MRLWAGFLAGLTGGVAGMLLLTSGGVSQPAPTGPVPVPSEADPVFEERLDPNLAGPFLGDPELMARLEREPPGGDCRDAGRLAFGCLIQARANEAEQVAGSLKNPFNLKVARQIVGTINGDLKFFRRTDRQPRVKEEYQIRTDFLTHPGSRVQLVGVINRLDRQFIDERIQPGVSSDRERCGEISVIYRFLYSFGADGDLQSSRLPITMNLVFPVSASDCPEIARRWLAELARDPNRPLDQRVRDVMDPATGVVAPLEGRGIERIELNFQAYRIPAGADETGLGSTAEYVIRVFRWGEQDQQFFPSYLSNQVDRARLLGDSNGDENSCDSGVRPGLDDDFRTFLFAPATMFEIDMGTLNIPRRFLACRALSASPGGVHRSANLPFWNALRSPGEQIFTDGRASEAIRARMADGVRFSTFRSAADFRQRLNELSCTGCHQARAIAGFHFPGADRADTDAPNAVLLPGSPHFYGDQPRRMRILDQLARLRPGQDLTREQLMTSYASRPLNRFSAQLAATELRGGWGGACLLPEAIRQSQREWTCREGLRCVALFETDNAPGMGSCVPSGPLQIGDAMQAGRIVSDGFRQDVYRRVPPVSGRDTRISVPAGLTPPSENSYYVAHQEYYGGQSVPRGTPAQAARIIRRDAQTGGFPGGMLRLSECRGLPREATCGLVAVNGFNDCVALVPGGTTSLRRCFLRYTAFAGMRACTSSSPCRDDYICLRSIGYDAANAGSRFAERRRARASVDGFDPDDFGEQPPDGLWLSRRAGGDTRGICIPPYFVFQFRSDKHPKPLG